MSVAVVVPVKNEQANIDACIRSVIDEASEVFVVDSGSVDATAERARALGARVVHFQWDGSPVKKRNWFLRNHRFDSEWVLFLDADERVPPALWREIESTLRGTRHSGFLLKYSNHFLGRELRYGDPMRKLALLRRGHGEFETLPRNISTSLDMEVHEHLIVDGSVGTLTQRVTHDDYKGVDAWFRRHVDYAAWEAQLFLARSGNRRGFRQRLKYRLLGSLFFPFLYFFYSFVIRGGFLDGFAGLRFAFAKWTYFVQVALRIAELRTVSRGDRHSMG